MHTPRAFFYTKKNKYQSLGKYELHSLNFQVICSFFSVVETAEEANISFMFSLHNLYINYNNSDIRHNT